MRNQTNTFFVDSCKLRDKTNTKMTIFAYQLTNCLIVSACFWGAVSFSTRIVLGRFSSLLETFNPLKHFIAL